MSTIDPFFFHLDEQFAGISSKVKYDAVVDVLPGMPVYFLLDEARPDRARPGSMRDAFALGHVILDVPRWHRP